MPCALEEAGEGVFQGWVVEAMTHLLEQESSAAWARWTGMVSITLVQHVDPAHAVSFVQNDI
jgi:hypothetical protein